MYVRVFSGFPNQNWKRSSHLNGSDILVCLSHSAPSRHLASRMSFFGNTTGGESRAEVKERVLDKMTEFLERYEPLG